MTDNQDQLNHFQKKLDELLKRQSEFQQEIDSLAKEIRKLTSTSKPEPDKAGAPVEHSNEKISKDSTDFISNTTGYHQESDVNINTDETKNKPDENKSDIENFIGENLANKIGIIITVIGVAIGVKFAINHQLINPVVRIILGYLGGFILLGFAIKFKESYKNYSSVLLSGSLAIVYFITYAAYDFYVLIPQSLTYALMLFFTVFAVIASFHYNKQVIALIGLVGSYAIPFLLGFGYHNHNFLFSYITIINAGILVIAVKKNWKLLYFSAFIITWLIYYFWFVFDFNISDNFGSSLLFLSIYYIIFYLIFLAYKFFKSENFDAVDVLILLANSSIYFGIGIRILDLHPIGKNYLGLFAVINALIHFIVSVIIYRNKLADRNLFYFVAGLVLVFITIAIPIQLNGNWVTLLWTGEAVVLFWVGRGRKIPFYEYLAYPLMILAFFSILQDWSVAYINYNPEITVSGLTPFLNINFLFSLIFIGAFSLINYVNSSKGYNPEPGSQSELMKIFKTIIPAILIISVYYSIRLEIAQQLNQLHSQILHNPTGNDYGYLSHDLKKFKTIWLLNYSLFFASALSVINLLKIKSKSLLVVNLVINSFLLLVFLTQGLYVLSDLRESYLDNRMAELLTKGSIHLLIRYITYVFSGLTLYISLLLVKKDVIDKKYKIAFDLMFHLFIIWVASSEVITWMDIYHSRQSYKFGLSILWGLYSLGLISLGIWKRKKYLRVGAIILFGVTLLKLFFYDISHMSLLLKTIIFISLGILLLIISFLYNKYKHIIVDESDA